MKEKPKRKEYRIKTYPFIWKRESKAEKIFQKYQKEVQKIEPITIDDNKVKEYMEKINGVLISIWKNIKDTNKKTPRNKAILKASLYYELFSKIRKAWLVSDKLKKELYKKSTEPVRKAAKKQRQEIKGEISAEVLAKPKPEIKPKVADPLLDYDPFLDESKDVIKSTDLKGGTIDSRLSRKIEELMNIEIPPNIERLNPLQIFILELLNAHILEPILQNIQVLTTKRIPISFKGSITEKIAKGIGVYENLIRKRSLDESIVLGLSYILRRLVKNIGAIIMKHPSIYSYDELMKTVLEMERIWNRTPLGTILRISPYRASIRFGAKIGKKMEGIESKEIKWDLIRGVLSLIQPLLPDLENLYKRKPEEVAKIRENYRKTSPERIRNMKVLLRFLDEIAIKKGLSRDGKFLINFLMRTVALMDSDRELEIFGRKTMPLIRYLAFRPDTGKELKKALGVKEEAELEIHELHRIIFPEYVELKNIPENFIELRKIVEKNLIYLRNQKKVSQLTFLTIHMALNRIEVMFAKNEKAEKIAGFCLHLIELAGKNEKLRKKIEPKIKNFIVQIKKQEKISA